MAITLYLVPLPPYCEHFQHLKMTEPYFCEKYKYQCSYINWLKNYDLKRKFVIFRPVPNLMHHPLNMNTCKVACLFFFDLWYICQKTRNKIDLNFMCLFSSGISKNEGEIDANFSIFDYFGMKILKYTTYQTLIIILPLALVHYRV